MSGINGSSSNNQEVKETSLKIRKNQKALREIVEKQKLRRVVQVELKSRQKVSENTETVTQSATQKLTVSCGSQTCSIQTEIHREQKVYTESATSPKAVATVECESEKQVFIASDSFAADPCAVAPLSPGRSQSASGNRTRLGNSILVSQTFPGSPRTPKSPRTPPVSRTPSTSPQAPRSPRTPNTSPPSAKKVVPPARCTSSLLRQINCSLDSKIVAVRESSRTRRSPKSPKKPCRNNGVEVKPLVNTYHVMTEKPLIRARKGAPKELRSSNVKDIFSWVPVTGPTVTANTLRTSNRHESVPDVPAPLEVISGSTSIYQPTQPLSTVRGVQRHIPARIDRSQDVPDELSDEEYRAIRPSRKCPAKPLVNTSFHPSPPKKSKDAVMMFVSMSGHSSVPEKAQLLVPRPPTKPKYNRSEVLAFMKRKRLEHRQQIQKGSVPSPPRIIPPQDTRVQISNEFTELFGFEETEQPKSAVRRVPCGARRLRELVTQLHDPRTNQLETLLAKFESTISAEIRECNVNEDSFEERVRKYASTKVPVEQRLEETTHRLDSFLMNLGLRESCFASMPRNPENSAVSHRDALTPSKSVRVSSFLSSLQDTPCPKSRASPIEVRPMRQGDALSSEHTPLKRNGTPPATNDSIMKSICTATPQSTPRKAGIPKPRDEQSKEQKDCWTMIPPDDGASARSKDSADRVGVRSDLEDPNFIFEWRQKYLKGPVVDSSTPKRNFTVADDAESDPDVSRILAEKVPDALITNLDASENLLSDIDDSALRQAREVLKQLDSSRRNLEKTQKIISEIGAKRDSQRFRNDSDYEIKDTSSGRRSRSRNSTKNNSVIIEGDDILEEAKRVLREINNSSQLSNKSNRSNASRNLANSFDKIFENESERKRNDRPTADSKSLEKSLKKSFAPGSLSNLATNELDFLEDCNDTLLKISEVSRAKNYAFARETNMANEFLRREYQKTSTPVRSEALIQLSSDEVVEELRKSLQEAFDKIENQSKQMSLLHKNLSTSQAGETDHDPEVKLTNTSVEDVARRQSALIGGEIIGAHVEREDDREASPSEKEKSRSSGSTKTANDTKSGSVSFETASLTDEKQTDSDGSAKHNRNSHSVSPETPSRSSLEKSQRSSPTASTVKTEVPKSLSMVSTVETPAQESSIRESPPSRENVPNLIPSPLEVAKEEKTSSPDTLSLIKSTAETLSTEETDNAKHAKRRSQDHPGIGAQGTSTANAVPEHPASQPESSDSALIVALMNYIERRELDLHGQRSESLKKLQKLVATQPEGQTAVPRRNEAKMPEGKDQRKERNELQKLLRILAKQKIRSKSSSSSDQQTNTSSEESSEILTDGEGDQENDTAKATSSSSKSHSIVLGTSDLIEHMDLVKLLIKRNNEISQKEKFVKYLERERQKIERRSEAIKKREAKLMAEMKAAVEREVNTKLQLCQESLVSPTGNSQKSESHALPLRPLSARKFRSRRDSSGSEDIASLSETDASDIEGSRRALKDEEERETRQLEKLKRDLETPDSNRRPGRKEMLMRRIEVLEKLLANNKAAVAMLESSSHVMPKIRKPRVAVQERSQESEESDGSREGLTEKSQQSKASVSESDASDAQAAPLSGEANSDSAQQNVVSRSSSSRSLSERSKAPLEEGSVSSSSSSQKIVPDVILKVTSPETAEAEVAASEDSESSKSESTKTDVKSTRSTSSGDSENTKNRKVDSTVAMLVHTLKEDTLKEVVKATKLEGHATNLMERLVGEAVGAINKAKTRVPADRDPGWDEFSPISSLNGTLAEIGQQIFVDDASQQVCIRTIPNKPPPPYTPPKVVAVEPTTTEPIQPKAVSIAPSKNVKEQRQPEPVVPMTLGELQTEASHAAEYLFEQLIAGRELDEASYEDTHCQGVADMAKVQYGEMLFDVAKETAEKLFRVGRNSDNMFARPLPSKERHQAFIDAIVGDILKSEKSKTTRPKCIWSYINNRRMDYIDFIMGKEIREEEKEWTEYTSCLKQVNEQLVEQVFAHIVETNVAAVIEVL